MIHSMREPPDEFARYLRQLRKNRGWSADRLSVKVGRAKSYLGRWERGEQKAPDRSVLLAIAETLKLTEPERRQLFHFAERRVAPKEAEHLYAPTVDPALNLVDALLSVDHPAMPGIDAPPARSALTASLAMAAGWLLALWAARSGLPRYNFLNLAWPATIYDYGLIEHEPATPAPPEFQLPNADWIVSIGAKENRDDPLFKNIYAGAMAMTYRTWLFNSIERCRDCATMLSWWSLERGFTDSIVTFRFRNSEHHDRFRVDAVSCDVVAAANRRRLESLLSRPRSAKGRASGVYQHIPDRIDSWPVFFAASTNDQLASVADETLGSDILRANLQLVIDALYCLSDADFWSSVYSKGSPKWVIRTPADRETGFDLGVSDDREELIDRLRRVERKITARLARITHRHATTPVAYVKVAGHHKRAGPDKPRKAKPRATKGKKTAATTPAATTKKQSSPKAKKRTSPKGKKKRGHQPATKKRKRK